MQRKSNAGAGAPPAGRARAPREAANPDNDADGCLLRLVKSYSRAELTLAKAERREDETRDLAASRRLERAVRRQAALARAVLSTPAATAIGALAKLQVAAAWFRPELVDDKGAPITHHADAALVAIADELAALGLSGAALASAPGPQIAPTQRSRTEASDV